MPNMSPQLWRQAAIDAFKEHHSEERLSRMRRATQLYRTGSCTSRDLQNRFLVNIREDMPELDFLSINLVQAVLENFVAQLYPEELFASVLPKRPNGDVPAKNVQELFNQFIIPEAKIDDAVRSFLWAMAIDGDGILKIGYVDAPKRRPSSDPERLLIEADVAEQLGGEFGFEDEAQYRGDLVWVQNVRSSNLIPAPGCLSLEEAPYVIHKIRRRFDHALEDTNYTKQGRAVLVPTTVEWEEYTKNPNAETQLLTEPGDSHTDPTQYVDILEIWDFYNQEFKVTTAGGEDVYLRESDWPFEGLEGYPFIHGKFKHDPESFFGIPMVQDIADLQEELNTISMLMLETMKRSVPFVAYDKNILDDKTKGAISQADLMGIVGVDGKPSDVLEIFPKGSVFSPDLYGVRNMVIQSMMLITGMTDFMMGQSQKTKSATEVAATAQGFSGRMNYKKRLFKGYLRDILRKAYQITRHRMTTEKWIRTVGATGAEMIQVTPQDVRAELDVDINAEIFDDRHRDPVRLKVVTDAMAPFLQNLDLMQVTGVNPVEAMRRYLRAIGERDLDKLQPMASEPVDPNIENQLMFEGQRVNVHPMDDDQQHLQTHVEGQRAVMPGKAVLFQMHIKDHTEQMQAKIDLSQQQAAQAEEDAMAGPEAPSRRTTPTAGSQQARTMQVKN